MRQVALFQLYRSFPISKNTHFRNELSPKPSLWKWTCLAPRLHYSSRSNRFASRGPSSDTSSKWIDWEGLGKRRTGTKTGLGKKWALFGWEYKLIFISMAARFASRNGLLDVYLHLSYIFMKGFLSRTNCENSFFSFLSRVCSRSYHLRDDRQIFCHEFLRRYICVLRRVVPHSGEVREFLQPPPRPRPQGLLVFLTRKSWGRGVFQSTQTRVQRSFPRGGGRNSKSATPDLFFTQLDC